MAFVRTQLNFNQDYVVIEGVIPQEHHLRLIDTDRLIEQILEQARLEADEIVREASLEAQRILAEARLAEERTRAEAAEQAKELLAQINVEWRRVLATIEPTAVAVARLAIATICDEASLAERVEMAARAAIRELPERPLRIRVPTGASESLPSALKHSLEVTVDGQLPSGAVCVEGEYSACDANFNDAQEAVTSVLESWIHRALALVSRDQGVPIVHGL